MLNSKEALTEEINHWKDNLILQGNLLEKHLIEKHRGLPATTCHNCLDFQHAILNDRSLIVDLERDLQGLNQEKTP